MNQAIQLSTVACSFRRCSQAEPALCGECNYMQYAGISASFNMRSNHAWPWPVQRAYRGAPQVLCTATAYARASSTSGPGPRPPRPAKVPRVRAGTTKSRDRTHARPFVPTPSTPRAAPCSSPFPLSARLFPTPIKRPSAPPRCCARRTESDLPDARLLQSPICTKSSRSSSFAQSVLARSARRSNRALYVGQRARLIGCTQPSLNRALPNA